MKKYLISIEQDQSTRLSQFFSQATFQQYKCDFKKIGVIGRDIPTAEYFKLAVAGKRRPITPAELGCTLSHIAALKDFLESNEKYACIFEDDAICLDNLDLEQLESQIAGFNLAPCLFFSLGGIQLKSNRKVRGNILQQELNGKKIIKIHPIYFGRFFYAYAYIVDREMAATLIDYHTPPQCYDGWSHIVECNANAQFYATYLFDHPEIDINLISNSYLESERNLNQHKLPHKNNLLTRLKVSILKRIYYFILKRYG